MILSISKNKNRLFPTVGPLDEHLPVIQAALTERLRKVMSRLDRPTLKLPKSLRGELSWILVEFMEDLHCGVGFWNSLELENRSLFQTPLPLIVRPPVDPEFKPDLASRIRHLLHVILPQLVEGLLLSPDHVDLIRIADDSAEFLTKAFAGMPAESGVQRFLHSPTPRGWDAKRKLVWLGTHSYLFRNMFRAYFYCDSFGSFFIRNMTITTP